ncbi:hypothetical protein SAMN05660649_01388 [Desulfotomaculum arcticum]|uniref:Uncharacterized protein n=1 Tax=Desulfotruncus arcticus DSM 17038 TaxID=1121424 RepID=A0A1I2RA13_9FIRM|nr:hypothetical protein [Desulfotruncus arcticus]SFG35427.1 hypothetical protein SAMN05660649_01388 [Desulfotomaculum arcticum] [Desulfotruncus arcticus DSM 17038]
MKLDELRQRLISYGYHPDEVEYALVEILQYKKAEIINSTDIKVLLSMLQERMEIARAELRVKIFTD